MKPSGGTIKSFKATFVDGSSIELQDVFMHEQRNQNVYIVIDGEKVYSFPIVNVRYFVAQA